jgi:phosphoglycolate phosphatase (TIGR01487 family)
MKIRLLVADVDGTITESRMGFRIPLEALQALLRLEESGIRVAFVSANALPVLAGLGRYLGLTGPLIGETGCLAYYRDRVLHLCRRSAKEATRIVEEEFSDYVKPSWQNIFRIYDFAYRVRPGIDASRLAAAIEGRLREIGVKDIHVGFSGFAIHLTPLKNAKAYGFRKAVELAGVRPDETAAIGDSAMDAPMLREAGLSIAVGDADEELKRAAMIVTEKPAGYGFAEAVELILSKYA